MFYSLFRILGGLTAAAVVGFGVFVIGAVSVGDKPTELQACVVGLAALAAALVVFVWVLRRLGSGQRPEARSGMWARWREKRQIEKRRAQALLKEVAPRAKKVARVLGGGSYTTATLRCAWDDSRDLLSVDAVEEGAWRTVFIGRFHPEVPGQVVPSTIRQSVLDKDSYSVSTTRAGHQAAWWEVIAYIPGEWEEELDHLWKESKQVEHEQEKDRFGL